MVSTHNTFPELGRWIEISAGLYFGMFHELESRGHKWTVFSSWSNPDGSCPGGGGYPAMDTDWGIKGTDYPVLANEWRSPDHERGIPNRDTATSRYFLFIPEADND